MGGVGIAPSRTVGIVGIELELVETAAAARGTRGRLLLVQAVAEDREGRVGRELGVTRKAEVDDSSSIMTGRRRRLRGHRRRSRGILLLDAPLSAAVGCCVLSLPMMLAADDDC